MSQRLEISFQIDEEDLTTALTEIRQAFAQFDPLNAFKEVDLLMGKLDNGQNRFPVEPGDEDSDDE